MYIWAQRGAPGAAAATSSSDVVPAIETMYTAPTDAAPRAVASSPSSREEAVHRGGRDQDRRRNLDPEHRGAGVRVGHVTQHVRPEAATDPRLDVRTARHVVGEAA